MPYIGCTKKLLNELKVNDCAEQSDFRGLRGWHGNTFRLYRSKAVLLVNDQTRFAIFIPRLVKKDFSNFDPIFRDRFKEALEWTNADAGLVAKALLQCGGCTYGKTHNRSVLGTMNDMKQAIEHILWYKFDRLPKTPEEIRYVTMHLNKTPYQGKDLNKYVFAAVNMRQMLTEL
ncbi:DUF6933 domain-containing protein [Maridesulfovibrio hydrothermalis]|uniref:DUF6933 domain-containing protein n=1 Tax=Maridesulfovibrio hydrothermalis AM13 = DSM 14728 TaxID=1121451 RepID=L0RCI2_9BACT|nr:hypothetical protein [Maridesulfovibrio hydrothermalis]CCO24449.1 protein of unknown function [Maridesulfovibrio hydrothermalis AM13 = DSM 14728]